MTKAQLVFDAQVHSSLYSQPERGPMEKAKDQSLFSPIQRPVPGKKMSVCRCDSVCKEGPSPKCFASPYLKSQVLIQPEISATRHGSQLQRLLLKPHGPRSVHERLQRERLQGHRRERGHWGHVKRRGLREERDGAVGQQDGGKQRGDGEGGQGQGKREGRVERVRWVREPSRVRVDGSGG